MRTILLIVMLSIVCISCDYAKQEFKITDLESQNMELKAKIQRYRTDSILRIEREERNTHRIKALRIIDSLKFKDPQTLEEIENQLEPNPFD